MHGIQGLHYQYDYIDPAFQQELIDQIDAHPWDNTLKRRTQMYGWRYDYKARRVTKEMYLGVLPKFLLDLACAIYIDEFTDNVPDQVIINEYQPGQGISAHIDCQPCFGPHIISLSLGSTVPMVFRPTNLGSPFQHTSINSLSLDLEPGMLLTLSEDARYRWTHEIPARKFDPVPDEEPRQRQRRISITFRSVILT